MSVAFFNQNQQTPFLAGYVVKKQYEALQIGDGLGQWFFAQLTDTSVSARALACQ